MNQTVKLVIILLATLVAVITTSFALRVFFHKLRRIEEERWGKTPWKGD